jgi:hypothetical protein
MSNLRGTFLPSRVKVLGSHTWRTLKMLWIMHTLAFNTRIRMAWFASIFCVCLWLHFCCICYGVICFFYKGLYLYMHCNFILPRRLYFFPLFTLRYLTSHRESNWCNQTGSSNLALESKLCSLCSRQVFNLTSDVLEQVDSPSQRENNLSVMRTPIHTIPLAMCGIPSLQPLNRDILTL